MSDEQPLPDPLRDALRAAWRARAQPPGDPKLQFSWEQEQPRTDNSVPFPAATNDSLALAARARGEVSPETRSKLAALVREMQRERGE